jgi:hypothetical protein
LPDPDLLDWAVDEVAHEEHAFVEADDDRFHAIGERGQRRRMHDRERPHFAGARDDRPVALGRAALRAYRPGRMPERAARRAPLDTQLAGAQRVPEARVIGVGRVRDGDQRSTPSSTAPDGSLIAPHTNATSAPATWLPLSAQLAHRAGGGSRRARTPPPSPWKRDRTGRVPSGQHVAALDERRRRLSREAVPLGRERHRNRERLDDQRDVDVGRRDAHRARRRPATRRRRFAERGRGAKNGAARCGSAPYCTCPSTAL